MTDKIMNIDRAITFIHKYMEYLREQKEYDWADEFREVLIRLGYKVKNER